MTTYAERAIRARAFVALVDASIRAEETNEGYIRARKAGAFEHIVEELGRLSPEALALIEDIFVPFYQDRLEAANKETENG